MTAGAENQKKIKILLVDDMSNFLDLEVSFLRRKDCQIVTANDGVDALKKTILQVSQFVEKHPEVRELDLNPVFAYPDGAIAVDARIVVAGA